MTITCINPVVDPQWTDLVDRRRGGLFHSPPWYQALVDTYGFELRAAVLTERSGAPRAGLAYSIIDDLLGRRIVSAPFSDACDPLVTTKDDWELVAAQVTAHGLPITMRCLDDRFAPGDPRFQTVKRARWHSLGVDRSRDQLWSGLDGSTQRALRKAQRSGVQVRPLDGSAAVHGFHGLHVGLRKAKYQLLAQPVAFFESIARRFGDLGCWHSLGAYLGDRLVAATIYLRWRDTLYYKFNASAQDALEVRANTALMWEGALLARSLGCTTLDMGPSGDDQPGLIRFKRQFGADEREVRYLRFQPQGWEDQESAGLRSLLGELTGLCTTQQVPDEVTASAGALLYRYFV